MERDRHDMNSAPQTALSRVMSILRRMQFLDRRYIYLLFFIFVVAAHFFEFRWPITASKATKGVYDTIESLPRDKVVVIDSDWGAGIKPEAEGQMRAVLRHIMRRGLKFIILSWTQNPEGQKFGMDVAADVARDYQYKYGTDWCALGAITKAGGATIAALAKDIHGTAKTDIYGTSLDDAERLPIMQHARDIYDVGLIFQIAYGYDASPWMGFVQGVYGTKYAVGVSAISSSTAYSYVESGQMAGMLAGAPGAAEYEALLKLPNDKRFARKPVNVLSMAIAYILFMMLLGNIAYLSSLGVTRQ
jgi:hypothetical protein